MDGIVLWNDESAFLRRLSKGWGILSLSGCPDEQAVADYVCARGFATQTGNAIRLSSVGKRLSRFVQEHSVPMLQVPAVELA
ncbi:hypothetical protein [Planctomyces sp. SH-PL14]|uniref:hypothetical protein n=1 Tax=Planctomyces sp. SH-PL14 TaxID=1632864 RepID=UPI00078EEAE8|nr:hypothetical protein [Planctomyces sp. SH-PL14]AMV16968.1 hypothetical protein VT03_03700 [Planctomyces sp. SH-PL14]